MNNQYQEGSQSNLKFGQLYDNYAPILYGHIYGILKNKSLAESILQESFVRIISYTENVTLQGKSFLFWMIQVCNQVLLQHENADKIKNYYCSEWSVVNGEESMVVNGQ